MKCIEPSGIVITVLDLDRFMIKGISLETFTFMESLVGDYSS